MGSLCLAVLGALFGLIAVVSNALGSDEAVVEMMNVFDVGIKYVVSGCSSKDQVVFEISSEELKAASEGRISTGKKVYFYRSNQMIVADNIADMEVGGRARSYASKGEVVELILNWNNDAYFKNCTSVRDSPAR